MSFLHAALPPSLFFPSHTALYRVQHLDPIVGDETPEDLKQEREAAGVPTADETPSVWVFAFGSNMKKSVLEGRRMIKPVESVAAVLPTHMLTFQQPGLPYREPGFATVEPLRDGARPCHGVAHLMTPTQWEYYKESEGAVGLGDTGYAAVEVQLELYDGRKITGYTLMTQPKSLQIFKGRQALPSLRYLELLRTGAVEHGLHEDYVAYLNGMVPYVPHGPGGKIGRFITGVIAYGMLFPAFAGMRLYRKVFGLHTVKRTSLLSKMNHWYLSFVFNFVWVVHDVVRPLLGCGLSAKPAAVKAD